MKLMVRRTYRQLFRDACDAAKVTLSHHDWYDLYLAAGKYLP